jgi:SAM-dependent methyltransferase
MFVDRFTSYLKFQVNFPKLPDSLDSAHLDLGSGFLVRNPFGARQLFGTDLSESLLPEGKNITLVVADLTKRLPFNDGTFDSVSAFDLLEHIPRWERSNDGRIHFPFINLMSEIHRILKPGGFFVAVTPAYPSITAFQDPTHINFISTSTLDYFTGENPPAKSIGYGFVGKFEKLHQSWLRGGGPYELIENRLAPGFFGRKEIVHLLKFIKRIIKLLTPKSKTHLLWVITAQK